MTRYLLGVDFRGGVVETPMTEWRPEEITALSPEAGSCRAARVSQALPGK